MRTCSKRSPSKMWDCRCVRAFFRTSVTDSVATVGTTALAPRPSAPPPGDGPGEGAPPDAAASSDAPPDASASSELRGGGGGCSASAPAPSASPAVNPSGGEGSAPAASAAASFGAAASADVPSAAQIGRAAGGADAITLTLTSPAATAKLRVTRRKGGGTEVTSGAVAGPIACCSAERSSPDSPAAMPSPFCSSFTSSGCPGRSEGVEHSGLACRSPVTIGARGRWTFSCCSCLTGDLCSMDMIPALLCVFLLASLKLARKIGTCAQNRGF